MSPLDQSQQPKKSGLRWVIGGLIGCGAIAIVSLGLLGWFAYQGWKQVAPMLPGNQPIATATPAGQGPFDQSARFFPPAEAIRLAAGDVDADGEPNIIAMAGPEIVTYDLSGQDLNRFAHPLPVMASGTGGPAWMSATANAMVGNMTLANLQGEAAIVLGGMGDDTVYVFRADGTQVFANTVSNTNVMCLEAADVDGDGTDEVLVGRDSQIGLSCLDDAGNQKWRHGSTFDPHGVTAADADGNGEPELFVSSMYGSGTEVLDADGNVLTTWQVARGETDVYAGDLDGDGTDELLLLGMPGAQGSASSLQQALQLSLIAVDSQGQEQWRAPLGSGMPMLTQADVVAADLDGNGEQEWVATGTDGTVRVYDKDGTEIGRQAFGDFIYAMTVTEPGTAGGTPTVWISMGQQIVGLQWTQWVVAQTTPVSP